MTSEVLYRKWRPRKLSEVVGQDSVTQTLRRSVATGRMAHAYLLCGPRGTGKTSTARILAKAINCLSAVDGEPDNECDPCIAINEGRALDLIEIDAASNRGIDDIRNLSDKINFAPNEFKFKVYIVDEVHMLTEQAFNALLKTLEEPPGHAIFVLATTEAHKVPLTIISRCQRYDFRRVPLDVTGAKLAELCAAENIQASQDALDLIARSSTGSLRDAENLLEQAAVSYGSPLDADQVREMLGMGGDEQALELAKCIVSRSVAEGLSVINRVAGEGADLQQLQRGVTEFLRSVMLSKTGAATTLGYPDETSAVLNELATGADLPHLLRSIRAFSAADTRRDTSSPLPLELALVESSLEPVAAPPAQVADAAARQAQPRQAPTRQARPYVHEQTPVQRQGAPQRQAARPAGAEPQPLPAEPAARLQAQWPQILRALRNTGTRFKLDALLRSSRDYALDGDRIVVKFSHNSHYDRIKEEMSNSSVLRELKEIINKAMDGDYEVVPEMESESNGQSMRQANQSHLVRAAQAMGARVVEQKEDDEQ
ncbi:MAG: DNA polymerase III subunit gamma/tau [SAR202 cluster bacterium]|jgi:DNA polymerase-3 subunit gamma/tau|nr:DNA polymerase III subunit gamma/tau [SAR202 cluster bacterium]MDP6665521.1 DNA polymerase III subunit gamma/tau [SAR202 cluster bacterium]MDP6799474.1 DNA polymerase III subunit gamma/tau [SAR202 cluster bacterium]MQG59364.1 DNA polymerase III subunit gamma/tau [SAR202 cluster bacterium]MQG69926.1 DNA polymerase III subunit gamma/tau [SAR202 cluster bacterium]|tara:strand:- start:1977 stop:3602 length:1626 start_codon:yes stop_codon:yes gene_type:complete